MNFGSPITLRTNASNPFPVSSLSNKLIIRVTWRGIIITLYAVGFRRVKNSPSFLSIHSFLSFVRIIQNLGLLACSKEDLANRSKIWSGTFLVLNTLRIIDAFFPTPTLKSVGGPYWLFCAAPRDINWSHNTERYLGPGSTQQSSLCCRAHIDRLNGPFTVSLGFWPPLTGSQSVLKDHFSTSSGSIVDLFCCPLEN